MDTAFLAVANHSYHFIFIIQQFVVKVNTTFRCSIYCLRGDKMYPRIRELREDSDFSQKEVAKLLNCSQQAYSNYELGTRDVPISVLAQLALIYKTSIDYIVGLSNNRDNTYSSE